MTILEGIKKEISLHKSLEKAKVLSRFFKTGKGEYGEGDLFLGLTVPESRRIAKIFSQASKNEISVLLKSAFHEERLIALLILMEQYKKGGEKDQKNIFTFYLKNTRYINNWDLVDVTCRDIVGAYLFTRDRKVLRKLARSRSLWERRIAIVSTWYFIARNQFEDTLAIAEILLEDRHDLIHKATGWMLREVGKRSEETEERFLLKYAMQMPRTMLRYAIERFPEKKRRGYLDIR